MLSFDDYKKISCGVNTVGQQLKIAADEIMQETFDNDIQTKQCYIYDYFHDDQKDKEYGYDPSESETKIPVKLKFIVKTYKSMAKDDPEYHILFEPNVWNSMSCKHDWFVKNYERFGVEFPVGLYVDIPDERRIYRRWQIMYLELGNQFVKCGVLRCNYLFKWIENDGVYRHKRQMWGVNASQSSYTSGEYTDFKMTSFDDQGKFYLPWNKITMNLRHDTRLFISMLQKEPWAYKITKVNNTHPKGVITYTVKQDRYDQAYDYVQLNPDASDYGDMYANYYASDVVPDTNNNFDNNKINYEKCVLFIESKTNNVRPNSTKALYAKVFDGENNDITYMFKDDVCHWSIEGEGFTDKENNNLIVDQQSDIETYMDNDVEHIRFKFMFRFEGDELYLDNRLKAHCQLDTLSSDIYLDIIAL